MRKLFVILLILFSIVGYSQGYNPSRHNPINDAIYPASLIPMNGRLMYYDSTLFVYRDFKDTSELRLNRTTSASRFGHELYSVHQGGTLNSDGSFTGGISTLWWWRNGVTDANLVKAYLDSVIVPVAVVYAKRLTDSTFFVARADSSRDTVLVRGTAAGGISSLVFNVPSALYTTPVNFSNTGGAWSGTMSLNSQNAGFVFAGPTTGSPDAPSFRQLVVGDLPVGIPNANLQNSSITFGIGTSGTAPNWSVSSPALGTSTTLNLPITNSVNTGIVNPTLFNYWSLKVDSTTESGDSVYEWRNGTRYFRYVVSGSGSGITSLNGLTATTQLFQVGTSGSDFNINSTGGTHTFNLPSSSAATRGLLTSTDWSTFNGKQGALSNSGSGYRWFVPGSSIRSFVCSGCTLDSTTNAGALTLTIAGSGTVTTVSVVSANGFAGTVANASTTPAITLSTSVTGLLFGNGTAISNATISSPLTYATGTLGIQAGGTSQNGYISSTDWNTFNGKQNAISLTTTGTSGAATFISNTLNIPQYQGQLTLTTTGTSGAATLVGNTLNIPQYTGGGGGGGGIGVDSVQQVTSGSSATQTSGYNIVVVNPASTASTFTLTTATTFHSSNDLYVVFGGTITAGQVVTSFTINAGAGLSIIASINPSGVAYSAGEVLRFHKIGTILYRWN